MCCTGEVKMAYAKKINQRTAQQQLAHKRGGMLVDVRSPVKYRDRTLPNAVNISCRAVSSLLKYPRTTNLVLFGESDNDKDIEIVATYAAQLGFVNIFTIGSIDNWTI